jgi:hypothetical protein
MLVAYQLVGLSALESASASIGSVRREGIDL